MHGLAEGTSYSLSEHNPEFIEVGKYTSIAGGVKIHGPDNHPWVTSRKAVSNFPFADMREADYPKSSGKGKIYVGNDVWIGQDARILSGVKIGDGAIIGAGAVVSKDVYPYSVVVGNPAKEVKLRFTPEQIEQLLEIKWWGWDNEKVRENITLMNDIDKFLEKYATPNN